MKSTMSRVVLGAVGLTLLSASATFASAAAQAEIYVVQGLPGVVADVSVDGRVVASGVQAAKIIGPVAVAPGKHSVTVSAQGAQVAAATTDIALGDSKDLVVHLPTDPSGAPVVTAYVNDVTGVPQGKARLTVAHTAAVGPADILVDGKVLFANVANGEELSLVVPAGTYSVAIVPTGKTTPVVLGPLDLKVTSGALNRVFAIGSPSSTTMNAAVQLITMTPSGSASPARVDSGTGGMAATSTRSVLQPVPFLAR